MKLISNENKSSRDCNNFELCHLEKTNIHTCFSKNVYFICKMNNLSILLSKIEKYTLHKSAIKKLLYYIVNPLSEETPLVFLSG
jgi:hypothetical protein